MGQPQPLDKGTFTHSRLSHAASVDMLMAELSVTPGIGLSHVVWQKRLAKNGLNQLTVRQGQNPFRLFLSQLNNPLILILLASAAVFSAWVFAKDTSQELHTNEPCMHGALLSVTGARLKAGKNIHPLLSRQLRQCQDDDAPPRAKSSARRHAPCNAVNHTFTYIFIRTFQQQR